MTLGCVAAGVCTREGRALVSGLVNINLPKVYLGLEGGSMKWIGDADNNIEDNNHACAGTYHLEAATTAVHCLLMYSYVQVFKTQKFII